MPLPIARKTPLPGQDDDYYLRTGPTQTLGLTSSRSSHSGDLIAFRGPQHLHVFIRQHQEISRGVQNGCWAARFSITTRSPFSSTVPRLPLGASQRTKYSSKRVAIVLFCFYACCCAGSRALELGADTWICTSLCEEEVQMHRVKAFLWLQPCSLSRMLACWRFIGRILPTF